MPTGAAWNVSNPLKPWAWFDKDSVRDIPFEWDLWLEDVGASYASHSISCQDGLVCTQSSQSAGVIKARIKKNPSGPDLVDGDKYWVTCHIIASDGQEEDQTVYLRITVK